MANKMWQGKRVLVSGGSAGVGRALGLRLAAAGADVCIVARGNPGLKLAAGEMRAVASAGARIIHRSVDVCDYPAVESMADAVWTEFGGLDLLLCNQGFAHVAALHTMQAADMERMLQVNVLGHAHLCKAFAPHLTRQGSGTVLLVSSTLGYLSTYGYAAYSASKWAVVGFAEGLRQELGMHGIDVKVAYFGTTETPGLQRENATKPKAVWEMESRSPFNRIRSADDVARRVLAAAGGRRFDNPLGLDSRFTFWASRHLPGLVRRISDRDLRRAIARHSELDPAQPGASELTEMPSVSNGR